MASMGVGGWLAVAATVVPVTSPRAGTAALLGTGGILIATGFALSVALCGLARLWAPRLGLVDRPGGRKAHQHPTPLGGGVAVWLATLATLGLAALVVLLAGPMLPYGVARHVSGAWERSAKLAWVLGLATVILMVGLIDDRVGLGWRIRLAAQFLLAAVLVGVAGVRITLFPPFSNVALTAALTVFWVVGLTNAFNFLDNMDGLAAGVGLIAAALFAIAQIEVESLFVPAVLLVLVGALGGFLVHNRYPARLFLGDAGSNVLGFVLGALTVVGTFTREPYSRYSVLTPLLVMAVPLYDMASVVLIRLREGRSPFQADRRHFSHRLVDRGLSPPRAVGTIYLVTLAGGLGALLLPKLDGVGAAVVILQTLIVLGVVALLESSGSAGGT